MMNLYHGDCLEIVPTLEAGSVDAIITDLPYGTTACKWDTIIPFDELWKVVRYVLKPRGAFITTASQPFTSALVMSNPSMFKCEWIWNKKISGNPMLAKYQPMKIHENIVVFAKGRTKYNPIMWFSDVEKRRGNGGKSKLWAGLEVVGEPTKERYPVTILDFSNGNRARSEVVNHPTQKPVALYEYLIKTYTNEGDTVLDICMGSGTTGVACKNTGRNFIGIEKDADYFAIAEKRINES